jgi:hypothetical protein
MQKMHLAAIATIALAAIAIASAIVIFAPQPQPIQCVDATGPVVAREIPLGSFAKIEVSGPVELYFEGDGRENARPLAFASVESLESVSGLVVAEVQGGVLKISLGSSAQPGMGGICPGQETGTKLFVSASGISSITAVDSARVFTQGRIYPEQLSLFATGSALIDANVSVDDLNSIASGFGTIILTGFAERHSATATTGGRIMADGLRTFNGFFEATDSGGIEANVSGDASATATTGGSIGLSGGAEVSSVEDSGGTVVVTPDDLGTVPDDGTEGNGDDGTLPDGWDEGEAPPDDGSEEPPPGDEEPAAAVCGNLLVETGEECEFDNDCSLGEECSECQCLAVQEPEPLEPMAASACTAQGGVVACAEIPDCLAGEKEAGSVVGTPACICCIAD